MLEVLSPFLARFIWRADAAAEPSELQFRRRVWVGVILFSAIAWGLAIWGMMAWLF